MSVAARLIREALQYGRPVGMGSNDQALAALDSLEAEAQRLRESNARLSLLVGSHKVVERQLREALAGREGE